MKRLVLITPVILALLIISGCSPKKVVKEPEQTITESTPAEIRQKQAPSETITTQQPVKENITDRQMQKAQQTEGQTSVTELQSRVKDIHFEFDKYDIKEEERPVMKEVAAILAKNRNIKVIIEGHCDERGTNEYNLGLGDRRANATKDYLVSLGIPSGKIETISYGEEKPLCSESSEECWTKNRRAHFVLTGESI